VVPIVFRGNQNFRAGDRCPYRTAPKALNLMADWCRPTVRHEPIENRGASITDHTAARIKKENRKILPGILCLLICLLIGGPPSRLFIVSSRTFPGFRASPLMPEEQDKVICELPRTATWSSFLKVIRRRSLAAAAKKKNKDSLSVARAGE
jgi:hypothetical protein